MTFFDQQLVTSTTRVSPRPRPVKNDGSILEIGNLHPQGHGESLVTAKVANLQRDAVVAG